MESPILRTIIQAACLAAHSIQQNILTLLEDEDIVLDGRKRPRRQAPRPDYKNSTWGKMLVDDLVQLRIPGSTTTILFRRRFRLPHPLFEMLMVDVRIWQSNVASTDITGRDSVPLELKVLGVLRILGRGSCFDGIKELTFISETTIHVFFHEFCAWFRKEMYPRMVIKPTTCAEIEKAMGPYLLLGLSGGVGSMDVVHIPWGMCPWHLKSLHTGKEGFPTIAYNCTGEHDGSFNFCTSGSYGACNDKTIVRFDSYIESLRTEKLYTEMKYSLLVSETGETEMASGVYVITDGGYHHWVSTMSATRHNPNPDFVAWRKQMESVRKDIECMFGVLKGRFRILKTPCLFHSKEHIDNMFLTCVGLHNMLHAWDRRDEWECGVKWGEKDGEFDDAGMQWGMPKRKQADGSFVTVQEGDDFSRCGRLSFGDNQVPVILQGNADMGEMDFNRLIEMQTETDQKFRALQQKLVKNYALRLKQGTTAWLRS